MLRQIFKEYIFNNAGIRVIVVLLNSVTNLSFSWLGNVLRKERHILAEENSISKENVQKSKVQRREKIYAGEYRFLAETDTWTEEQ